MTENQSPNPKEGWRYLAKDIALLTALIHVLYLVGAVVILYGYVVNIPPVGEALTAVHVYGFYLHYAVQGLATDAVLPNPESPFLEFSTQMDRIKFAGVFIIATLPISMIYAVLLRPFLSRFISVERIQSYISRRSESSQPSPTDSPDQPTQ